MKPPPATTTARVRVKNGGWNFLKCAYMVMTFFFVSYNKGDWVRRPLWVDAFQSMEGGRVRGRRAGEERMSLRRHCGRRESTQCSELPCQAVFVGPPAPQ